MTESATALRLFGGVVAYNEEERIMRAVSSLLQQQLPRGASWSEVCIVASGCTDRTAEVVQAAFSSDSRVRLLVEAERVGKAAAVNELSRRAVGDWMVLLDGDCEAGNGAVAALLEAADRPGATPIAVGGRHVPPELGGAFGEAIEFVWSVLHQRATEGHPQEPGHILLDNLALLPVGTLASIPPGTINDAEFLEAEVLRLGGSVRYSPEAVVAISVPSSWAGYLRLRRRVLSGHSQARARAGSAAPTLARELTRHPVRAGSALLSTARRRRVSSRALAELIASEGLAHLMAFVDGRRRWPELSRWPRIPAAPAPSRHHPEG